jgi:putative endopeptidase
MHSIKKIAPWLVAFALVLTMSAQDAGKKPQVAANSSPVLEALDRSVDPCVDFYQFACGGWKQKNPLPADRSSYSRFTELLERNNLILKDILEKASQPSPNRSANDQKIGDYYATCMDEATVNKAGVAAIKEELDIIEGVRAKRDLTRAVTELRRRTIPGFFAYYSQADLKDASRVIANFDQAGLGLPNRDYYFKEDANFKETRDKYVAHVAKMLELSGYSPERAAAGAKAIMAIETTLADGSLTPVEQRDPQIQYHIHTIAELEKMNPSFDWSEFITGVGTPPVEKLNVVVPKFAEAFEKVLAETSVDDLKTYMRWHLLHDTAPLLSDPFVNENFNFYNRHLAGTKELRARWKRCVELVDNHLGEALGIAYVERTFGKEAKTRMLKMIGDLYKALEKDITQELTWMMPETKKQALRKLSTIANKIGYPDKWRDYSTVKIDRSSLIHNGGNAAAFEYQRQLNKIGKPVDKTEWFMSPPTVNAYYNPLENNINFPAGILQPPFFYKERDDALNYGGIGVVIGHEITHGFDDQGRQFDAEGNMKDWWTPEDNKRFDEKASCFVNQYGNYVATGDVKLNGKLTLGENAADNGGMRIAWMALMDLLAKDPKKKNQKIDGFTPEQRFFLGFAQVWCNNRTEQSLRLQAQTDPHSPGNYRANGTVRNMPEFQKAFACKTGQPMAPKDEERCRVW